MIDSYTLISNILHESKLTPAAKKAAKELFQKRKSLAIQKGKELAARQARSLKAAHNATKNGALKVSKTGKSYATVSTLKSLKDGRSGLMFKMKTKSKQQN
jgi:hypothetical protein